VLLKIASFLCAFLQHHTLYHLEQQPPRTLRFTHRIQAIKFSLVYRVAARKGLLAAERLRTSGCLPYDNITSTYFRKSELKRCCCCHV